MKNQSRREMLKNSMIIGSGALMIPNVLFSSSSKSNEILSFKPEWNDAGTTLRHSWEGLGNVDQARWFIRRDMQDQLEEMHKDLNLKHVRAVGLFDDELRVYGSDPTTWRSSERKPRYNWQIIDYIFDSLLERGINPMITTSFMPSEMSSGTQTCFSTKANVCPPKDYKQWTDLVTKSVKHFSDRYGENLVKTWYFEVWNEPNLDAFWKGADKQEFFKLYRTTFDAIKSVNPNFRVGGPSTARAEWVGDFIEYGSKNNCLADYIITHVYNNDSENAPLSPFDGPQSDKTSQSPNFLSGVVKGTRKVLENAGFKGELHFNEWGRSWFPSDAIRESQNEAAFIVKSMAECSQYADYFAYWCLSDIYDQMGFGSEAFHGNYGMMSLQGLKKPSYKAFQLLGKLGDKQVRANNSNSGVMQNAIATKSKDGYQFLFYAMEKDFQPGNQVKKTRISVELPVSVSADKIVIYQIGNTENNILNNWNEMRKPAYLSKPELAELKKYNELQKTTAKFQIEKLKESRILSFETEIPGVALVEMGV